MWELELNDLALLLPENLLRTDSIVA